MSNGTQTPFESIAPRAVDIDAIERELAELWNEPDAPESAGRRSRACMSNLVVVCGRDDEVTTVTAELAAIVQPHPSRVLLIATGVDAHTDDLDAFVSAQCYRGTGGRQICSEQVVVRARADAVGRLPSIVRSLIIGDLPTTLWWAAENATENAVLIDELAAVADQILCDSATWGSSVSALRAPFGRMLALLDRVAVADLAWLRLQPWLRFISDVLDPKMLAGAIEAISEVVIEPGARGVSQAVLLASWLASRLGWQPNEAGPRVSGAETAWTFATASSQRRIVLRSSSSADAAIGAVTIRSVVQGTPVQLTFTPLVPDRLEVTAEGTTLSVRFHCAPPVERAALVAHQLSERARNWLFQETLNMANGLIGNVKR